MEDMESSMAYTAAFDDDDNITSKKRPAPKVSGEWNDGDVEQLITQVEMHPSLWDVTSTGHKNKDRRDVAWKAVADSYDGRYTIKQCGIKWQVLRSGLRKELIKLKSKKSGQAATAQPRWKHFNSMSFIIHAACDTISESNVPPLDIEVIASDSGSTSRESGESDRPHSSASSKSDTGINPSGAAIRKRKAQSTVVYQSTSKAEKTKAIQLLETVAAKFSVPSLPVDEWKTFSDHVAAELRSLPYGQAKLLSRKISRCMLDFVDENCPHPSQAEPIAPSQEPILSANGTDSYSSVGTDCSAFNSDTLW